MDSGDEVEGTAERTGKWLHVPMQALTNNGLVKLHDIASRLSSSVLAPNSRPLWFNYPMTRPYNCGSLLIFMAAIRKWYTYGICYK